MQLFFCRLPWWAHVIIHLSEPLECPTPRVNANVNGGLWVIMTCHCRFMDGNKCTTAMCLVSNGGGCAHVESEEIRELSVLCTQFCCESKTALEKLINFLKVSAICYFKKQMCTFLSRNEQCLNAYKHQVVYFR